ncbi:MAG TPA: hypothetical protein DEV81_15725 [Cyanobacteria bacterium UBA11049]|nr:hypothetical protein [Cyanobacteria bacterium UBA11049]
METKEVFVQAHVRVIRQRVYRFVCKDCNQVVERICYPSQPLFCDRCRPPKSKTQKPSPKVIKSKKKSRAKQTVSQNNGSGNKLGK